MKTELSKKISIRIDYQLIDSLEWCHVGFVSEQYFDLEPGEEPSLEFSVEKYSHAINYLQLLPSQVRVTHLFVEDHQNACSREITEFFLEKGENRLIDRKDFSKGKEIYNEMIQELKVRSDPPTTDIIRMSRINNILSPLFHGRIMDNPDGSQDETVLWTTSKPEERK